MNLPLKLGVVADAYYGGKHNEYRYLLTRSWDSKLPSVTFIMLNPSTATHESDDPTVSKCQVYARLWGYGSIQVVNLFAYRATSPFEMKRQKEPVGEMNDKYISMAVEGSCLTVCAWGNHGSHRLRSTDVRVLLRSSELSCLRMTNQGEPQHPLYLPMKLRPVPLGVAA